MKTVVVQKAIIKNANGKILIVRRSETDAKRPLQWDLPGGHAEPGESLPEAIAREVQEETNIQVLLYNLSYATTTYHEWDHNKENVVRLFYTAIVEQPLVTLSSEHCEYAWCSVSEALQHITYEIQAQTLTYLQQKGII